jgi:hypothetical protein
MAPGRRVYPHLLSATVSGIGTRASYQAECNALPIWVRHRAIRQSRLTSHIYIASLQHFPLTLEP